MNRILLVRTYRDVGAGGPVAPLGLLCVAASLRRSLPGGCEIRLLDAGLLRDPEATVEAVAAAFRPALTGFSALSCEAPLAHRLAAAARRGAPSTFIVFGGPYPTVSPAEALADPCVDACVAGEGEGAAAELAAAVLAGRGPAGIPGVAVRGAELASRPLLEDLDELPRPAWDLADLKAYSGLPNWNGYIKQKIYAPLQTSRGCPYRCVYCHNLFGKHVRARRARAVLDEVLLLRDRYGVREFHVVDDVFNFDKARLLEFCRLVRTEAPGLAFSFPNGLRADLFDAESAAALAGIGTYKIHFGVESASARIRAAMRKCLSLEEVDRAVRLAGENGITTGGYFMFGFPGETSAEMRATADYAAASAFDAAYFFRVTAYPGTELYESLPVGDRPAAGGGFFSPGAGSVRDAEIRHAILRAQRKFYTPGRLWRLARKTHNPAGLLRVLPSMAAGLLLSRLEEELGRRDGGVSRR